MMHPYGREGLKEIRKIFVKFPVHVLDTVLTDATPKKREEAFTREACLRLGKIVRR